MAQMTPGARLALLEPRLDAQARAIQMPDDYYEGKHRLEFATAKFRQQFGSLFNTLAVNWCQLVVDAVVERLRVEGFAGFGSPEADKATWEHWQANNMDLKSRMLHAEAVKCGRAYTLVEPPASRDDAPNIYVEHPSQVIVQHAPGRREERVAALKKWLDDDGYLTAVLYLPEAVYRFRSQQPAKSTAGRRVNWAEGSAVANPLGVVPVVPFYNGQQMLRDGRSDLTPAIPIQDILNKLIADMLVDSEATAFVQRWVTGWEAPKDANDRPLPETEIQALRSKFLTFKDPDVKVGELSGSSLERFVAPIGMVIQHFSAVTRMPPHYLIGQIVNASGDALKAAETGLTFKAKGKIDDFSDPHEETQRLAHLAAGNRDRALKRGAETGWKDPETKSDAELTDSAIKLRSVGVPLEVIWDRLGFTPQQIDRMKTLGGLPDRPPPGATTAAVPPVASASAPAA